MNALSYIKNVGKSFGYSAIDTLKSYNSTSIAFAKNTKEFGTELYQSIKDFREKASDIESEKSLTGDLRDVVSDIKTSIIEDLKSGNFYNKQRVNKAEDTLATAMFGDFGDDGFDDFDFEFDDDDNSSDDDLDFAEEKSLNSELEDAIDTVGQKASGAISMATIESADYVVQSGKQNTRAIYALTNRGFNQVSTGLAAVNSNISNLVQLGEPLTSHMQNSSVFYTKSTEYQEKAIKYLESIAKNTTPVETKRESISAKNTIGSLLNDGALDIAAYVDMVKENSKSIVDMAKGFLDMAGGVKGAGAMVSASPLQIIPNLIINNLMPKNLKDTMKTFDSSLQGFFGSLLGNMRDKSFGDGMIGTAFDMIKGYLLPQSGYKDSLSVRGYEKGKVDWDGKSRKSLLEVIPTQLAQIVAAVTGKPEQRFDFETGKWKTISQVRKEFEQDRIRYASMAGGDYIDFLKDSVNKLQQAEAISADEAKALKQQISDFNFKAFHSNNSDFTKIMKDDFNYTNYGLTKEGWDFIRNANRAAEQEGKYDLRMRYNSSIYETRDSYGDARRRQEQDGSNLALQLYNGSILSEEDEKKRSRTILGTDQYNNDMFFYLQGIYQYTKHVSDNIGIIGSSGNPSPLGGGNNGPTGGSSGGIVLSDGTRIGGGNPSGIIPVQQIQSTVREQDREEIDRQNANNTVIPELSNTNITDAVRAMFSDDLTPGTKLNSDLQEYLDRKQAALEAGLNFEEDADKEEQIKVFNQVTGSIDNVTGGLKNKIKNSKFVKPIVSIVEKFLKVPTDVVTDFLNAGMVSMRRVLYGEKPEAEEKGVFGLMASGMKNIFDKLDKKVEDIFGKAPSEIFKDAMTKIFGEKDEEGIRNGGALSGFANATGESLGQVKDWLKELFVGSAADGRKVTKTGLIAVSEGEMVIPAEYNPFYKKAINKQEQKKNEANAVRKFYGMYNEGGTVEDNTTGQTDDNGEGETSKFKVSDNSVLGVLKMLGREGMNTLGSGARSIVNSVTGKKNTIRYIDPSDPNFNSVLYNDKYEVTRDSRGRYIVREVGVDEEDGESKLKKTLNSLLPEIKTTKGAMGAGALIGGGVSLLTGAMVGPILGAGIGAATGLVLKSEKVNKLLFGDDEKDGLAPEKISNFVRQNLDKTAKGAVVGGTAGLFLGSPVLGMILGSTAGYISSSDKAKKWLFGDEENEGVIKKNTQEMLKKAMPNISAGAIAGLVAGPFGSPIANIIAGSAIGYATTNEKFKSWIFGNEEEDKEGLIPLIKRKVLDPIVGIFDKLAESIKHHVRNVFNGLNKAVTGLVRKFFKNSVKRIEQTWFGKAIKKVGNAVVKAPVHAVGGLVRSIDTRLERSALRKGYSVKDRTLGRNLSAQERLDRMQDRGMSMNGKYATINKLIASMSDEPDNLNEFNRLVQQMTDPTKAFDDKLYKTKSKARDLLNNAESASGRKIFKLLKNNKFDKARELLNRATDINDMQKEKILETINEYEQTYNDRNIAENNTEEARKRLIERSGLKGVLDVHGVHTRELFNLKDSDMRNIQDLIKDEQNINKQKEDEKNPEDQIEESVTHEIPDILKDIASILAGNTSTKNKYRSNRVTNPRFNDYMNQNEEETTEIVQATNNIRESTNSNINQNQSNDNEPKNGDVRMSTDNTTGTSIKEIYRDPPGVWEPDNTDTGTRNSLINKNKIIEGLSSLTVLGPAMEKTGSMFTALSQKLFNREEDKPSFLSNLLNGAVDKISGFFGESNGLITGIKDFFTGGDQNLSFFNKITSSGFMKKISKGLFGYEVLVKIFDDNSMMNKIASKLGFGRNDESKNGKFEDKEKNEYINKGKDSFINVETGKKIAKNTKIKSKGDAHRAQATETLAEKARRSVVEGTLRGKGNIAQPIANKTIPGFKKLSSKASTAFSHLSTAGDALKAGNIDEAAAGLKLVNNLAADNIVAGMKKLQQGLTKVPFVKTIVSKIDFDKLTTKLVKLSEKFVAKAGTKAAKMASTVAHAVPVLNAVFFVTDFITGYQDASATFKVKNPSMGQKIVSAFIRSIKNLIPIVGIFIPDHILVDLVVEFVAPALGLSMEELTAQRDEAEAELNEYNAKNGTDYTWEEYNKQVLGNYTITEKIGNGIQNGINSVKAGIHNFKVDVNQKGGLKNYLGDKISSVGTGIKNKVTGFGSKVVDKAKGIGSKALDIGSSIKDKASDMLSSAKDGISDGVKTITTGFSDTVSAVASGISSSVKSLFKGSTDIFKHSIKGDFSGVWGVELEGSNDKDKPANGFTKGILQVLKVASMPHTLVGWAGSKFFGAISSVAKSIGTSVKSLAKGTVDIFKYSKNGDFSGVWNVSLGDKDDGQAVGGITKAIFQVAKVMSMPGTLMNWVGGKIKDLWSSFTEPIKNDWDTLTKGIDDIKTKASNGDVSGVFSSSIKLGGTLLSPIFEAGYFINKIFNTISALINKIAEPILDFFDNPVFNKIASFISGGGYGVDDSGSGSGAGNSGLTPAYEGAGASGFVSQKDPIFSGKKIGKSTVNKMGCGPASAVMAMNDNNTKSSMDEAINIASKHQTKGGTDISFFADYFNKKGSGAKYYNLGGGASKDKSLIEDIKSGNNVVLMGQDKKNHSKSRSPFGPNNHYVVATGMDDDDNVIINDPELRKPGKKYKPSILNNVKAAVSAAAKKSSNVFHNHISSLAGGASGIKGSASTTVEMKGGKRYLNGKPFPDYKELRVDSTTRQIWAFLKKKGCTDECAAGIMGNMQQESTCNPSLVQYSSMNAAGLFQWENYKSRNSRWMEMARYCAKHGKEWTDLNCQLNFMWNELKSQDIDSRIRGKYGYLEGKSYRCPGGFKEFIKLNDAHRACLVFEMAYERASATEMEKRYKYTDYYLKKFAGKTIEYTGEVLEDKSTSSSDNNSSSSSDSSGSEESSSSGNILETIISAFTNGFTKLLGGTVSSPSNSSSSNSSEYNSSTVGNESVRWKGKQDPVSFMKSKLGKLVYSQQGPRDPDKGSADCSSTVAWAVKKAGGPYIGGDTGSQITSPHLETVWENNGKAPTKFPKNAQRNDLIFYGSGSSSSNGRKYGVSHVDMYMGDGKRINHGGGSDGHTKGTTIGNTYLSSGSKHVVRIARVKGMTVDDSNGSSEINKATDKKLNKKETKQKASSYEKYLKLPKKSSAGYKWTDYIPGQGSMDDESNYKLWREWYVPKKSSKGENWKDYKPSPSGTSNADNSYYEKWKEIQDIKKASNSKTDKKKTKKRNNKKAAKGAGGSGLDILQEAFDEVENNNRNTDRTPELVKTARVLPFISRGEDSEEETLSRSSDIEPTNTDLIRKIQNKSNIAKIIPRSKSFDNTTDRVKQLVNKKEKERIKRQNMLTNARKALEEKDKVEDLSDNRNMLNDLRDNTAERIKQMVDKREKEERTRIERISKAQEIAANRDRETKISENKSIIDRVQQLADKRKEEASKKNKVQQMTPVEVKERTDSKIVEKAKNNTIPKETAAMIKVIITLVEQLVGNTKSIENIYELLSNKLSNKTDVTENSKMVVNNMPNSSPDHSLSALKEMMDEILAS